MISGHGNVEMAVNAMKMGAFDFIEKPFKIDHILLTATRALEQKSLRDENSRLKKNQPHTPINHHYKSPAILQLMKQINDHAEADGRLMIIGEQGTGKTRAAHLVHKNSLRRKNKIITVNASGLDNTLLDKAIEQAHDGTLLIENIHLLANTTQSHFLNIVTKNTLSCRIITTTINQQLKEFIQNKAFSSALYDRLSVIKYNVPSLAQRHEDIDILINEFIKSVSYEFDMTVPQLSMDVVKSLKEFNWIGNIRQLKIAIEWIVISTENQLKNNTITMQDVLFLGESSKTNENNIIPLSKHNFMENLLAQPLKQAREEFEKYYLTSMMDFFNGNVAKMAEHIDMERTALYRKLKSLEISYDDHTLADEVLAK